MNQIRYEPDRIGSDRIGSDRIGSDRIAETYSDSGMIKRCARWEYGMQVSRGTAEGERLYCLYLTLSYFSLHPFNRGRGGGVDIPSPLLIGARRSYRMSGISCFPHYFQYEYRYDHFRYIGTIRYDMKHWYSHDGIYT